MSPSRQTKRPSPDTYDHLWMLLPVFVAFLAAIVLVAACDDRQLPSGQLFYFEALPAETPEANRPTQGDPSLPPTEAAMARLPDVVAEPVPTF